jgi:hypothetical protein
MKKAAHQEVLLPRLIAPSGRECLAATIAENAREEYDARTAEGKGTSVVE